MVSLHVNQYLSAQVRLTPRVSKPFWMELLSIAHELK